MVDSVATKHMSSLNTYGAQKMVLNDVGHVPFEDRGGIMGFEILPIEPREKLTKLILSWTFLS
jgi:hypothetical protein